MSYRNQQNITLIDELPDIEEIEPTNLQQNGMSMIPRSEVGKFQKFIRNNNYDPHQSSGMSTQKQNDPYRTGYLNQGSFIDYVPEYQINRHHLSSGGMAPNSQQYYEPYEKTQTATPPVSCLDLADHAANCPICVKIYNNDKTIYILAIAILCIICILLLKRILDL